MEEVITISEEPARQGGRKPSTTRTEISHVALDLFIENGFENTTIDDIASAAGIARRTFFRYFASKNDLPWGDFEFLLENMRMFLSATPDDLPLLDALGKAVVEFNRIPEEEEPYHRERMKLLLNVPALVAHSGLRYASWRQVVAEFAGQRLGKNENDIEPQSLAWVLLGISLAAYEQWLRDDSSDLKELLERAVIVLRSSLESAVGGREGKSTR
jgi:mycofactocin system transcriptional regulator